MGEKKKKSFTSIFYTLFWAFVGNFFAYKTIWYTILLEQSKFMRTDFIKDTPHFLKIHTFCKDAISWVAATWQRIYSDL